MAIDEFDAKLHPNLTRKIVELFHNPRINSRNAQLVFVTHDSNLLDHNLLRRDQICFVQKDKYGASTLTSLVEYKGVRNDASYEKDYLRGKYGAIPNANIDQAIRHAKRLFVGKKHLPFCDQNPCTTVYQLVVELKK